MCLDQISGIASHGEPDATRLAACIHLLDRGWGKVEQPVTGADGNALEITIRTIILSATQPQVNTENPKVIEHGED